MNGLTKRLTADLGSLKPKSYKESWNSVAFYGKINIRRKLRPKSAKFGSFIDFEHDFSSSTAGEEPLTLESLNNLGTLDWQTLRDLELFFLNDGILHRKVVYKILALVEEHYRSPNVSSLVDVTLPEKAVINVCGDIHGQLYDLVKLFKLRGRPSPQNFYLFNGDIVDKGAKSLECILLLFLYKLLHPDCIFLNRGNHESSTVNLKHGFHREITKKYGNSGDNFMFEFFGEIFRWMPFAHLINDKILVVHGGISGDPNLTLDSFRQVK